jgi:hypothetical protein
MSEYQYHEFQAIDRPLTEADRQALRAISTRARITATSFTNSYVWGDMKGDPAQFMARWFDLHLYLANWEARRLMIRLPRALVEPARIEALLRPVAAVTLLATDGHLILDIQRDEVEVEDWDDGAGWLAALAPLRTDLLAGDLRLLHLLWQMAIEAGDLDDDDIEPLPGLGPLTPALEACARFLGIDPDLVEAAAERVRAAHGSRSAIGGGADLVAVLRGVRVRRQAEGVALGIAQAAGAVGAGEGEQFPVGRQVP